MPAICRVTGRIVNPSGEALAGVKIEVSPLQKVLVREPVTGRRGG